MNDPNAPFFDPKHNMYHIFWQAHLAQVDPVDAAGSGPAIGPVYGHAVSHDLVTWARLPVALWNDEIYDSKALYTGSATVVDGNPIIVYPGISDPPIGGTLNIAQPLDRSDPLLEHWVKSRDNPMMTGTSDDPSSAWKTNAGEWRFVGQTVPTSNGGSMPLYSGGSDLSSIHMIGTFEHEQGGDCMSIFPLHGSVTSTDRADVEQHRSLLRAEPKPTHVMLQSGQTKLGVLQDAPVGNMSTWRNSFDVPQPGAHTCGCNYPGCTANFQCGFKRLDLGARYAEKDFYDPVKHRRLLWGWAVVDEGSLGLPRELRYDANLGQTLIKAPLQELTQLRVQPPLASLTSQYIPVGGHQWLGDQLLQDNRGNQSELRVSFQRPNSNMVIGVDVMAGSNGAHNSSQRVYIVYSPNSSSVRVGVASGSQNLTGLMNATQLTVAGHNLPDPVPVPVQHVDECTERCTLNSSCFAWSVNHTTEPFSCVLLRATGWDMRSDPTTQNITSGIATWTSRTAIDWANGGDGGIPGVGGQSDTLQLLSADETLDIAVYTDNTILEVYWQGGRVAMTLGLDQGGNTGMDLFAFSHPSLSDQDPAEVLVRNADVWQMRSIWATPNAVKDGAVAASSSQAR
jgi:sucrose-6-phosphate hydrolase SacC (GH32 family)